MANYLGFDFSTQQLKAVILDDDLETLYESYVQFDTELPEFRTQGGAICDKDGHTVTAPTIMWIKALDLIMDKLRIEGADLSKITALSGSAQQHGSVYWTSGAEETLKNMKPNIFLYENLMFAFSLADSPIWQDSSTTDQCRQIEDAVGGPEKLAEITGSKAYERFTGSQVAKVFQTKPSVYSNTERISLVSSFACSLFLGKYSPIDYADGSGMNLMDIHTKQWNEVCLQVCGSDLADKLGDLVPSNTDLGPVSSYFVERFGINSECRVIAFTGDNPSSLAGMCLSEGDIAVSLGTSDTIFLWVTKPKTMLEGHLFCNPIDKDAFMPLLCFKNGSLTRERIAKVCASGSWDEFNVLLNSTPRGNHGNMGLYFDFQEIIPFVKGNFRFNKCNCSVSSFSPETEVRALIEGQFIAKRAHAEDLGFEISAETRILATGGASNNTSILQVLSDVFNAKVYLKEGSNSAMLGSAYRAKFGVQPPDVSWQKMIANVKPPILACSPNSDASQIYNPMVNRYRNIIKKLRSDK